ncbi:v-type h+-transporting atpase 16kda proteolipid subunit [Purpureocillium lavendulum]|uniref:V-type h+-transporting atpase 16kda proteolipid subunit n=1 Tax=Purpureocillium lavendulum TaxID=1247861 RepID=A0AB34G028_9HYPO|nr:v-type h+-transporting atpase 16kda proteolipid subunit [Purpureocillium lavendulum]
MSIQRLAFRTGRLARIRCTAASHASPPLISLRHSSTAAPASVADTGFWKSLVPKPLRKENRQNLLRKTKDWNPATYFIVMFLFIGSMSIQMIALRKQTEHYARQSSNRIAQLREVVQRIQNGEDVDVEKVLGTGDPQREADWEESACWPRYYRRAREADLLATVLKAIENDEASRKPQKQEKQPQPDLQQPNASPAKPNEDTTDAKQEPPKRKTANLGNFF